MPLADGAKVYVTRLSVKLAPQAAVVTPAP